MLWAPIAPPTPAPAISPDARRYPEGQWRNVLGYRSGFVRARGAQILLAVSAAVSAIAFAFSVQGLQIVYAVTGGEYISLADREAWLEQWTASVGLYILVGLATSITFLMWFGRAVDNLPPLAGGTPSRGPRQAIGWWFVPIANLVLPYLVANEAWARYATPRHGGRGWYPLAWWLLFVVSQALILGLGRLPSPSPEDPDFRGFLRMLVAGFTLAFALATMSAILSIRLIHDIERRASDRVDALGLRFVSPWAAPPTYLVPPPGAAWPSSSVPGWPVATAAGWPPSGQTWPQPPPAWPQPPPAWPSSPAAWSQPSPAWAASPPPSRAPSPPTVCPRCGAATASTAGACTSCFAPLEG